jgi:hypothetical protein
MPGTTDIFILPQSGHGRRAAQFAEFGCRIPGRHGYTSAIRPGPTRVKNAYIREDQITPHLAAQAILLASHQHLPGQVGQVTSPAQAAALIDHLHSSGRTLTYDLQHRTLRPRTCDGGQALTVPGPDVQGTARRWPVAEMSRWRRSPLRDTGAVGTESLSRE